MISPFLQNVLFSGEFTGDYQNSLHKLTIRKRGYCVHAANSTCLKYLFQLFNDNNIPARKVKIGTVLKKDVIYANMMAKIDPAFSVIIPFDCKIYKSEEKYADTKNVIVQKLPILYNMNVNY